MKNRIIPAICLIALFSLSSCEELWEECIRGNGSITSETRTLTNFDRIQVNGDFDVEVDTGADPQVWINTDENLMDFVVTHVSGNRLVIEDRDDYRLKPSRTIRVKVTAPALSALELHGSGHLYCNGVAADELDLSVEGSGNLECFNAGISMLTSSVEGSGSITGSMTAENLTSRIEGSGEIRLTGESASAELRVIGSGHIRASQLYTNACVAYISGSGNIDTHVSGSLDVTIIGSGMVYYSGDPAVETYISGSGRVIHQ
jgi:hypothetical protein